MLVTRLIAKYENRRVNISHGKAKKKNVHVLKKVYKNFLLQVIFMQKYSGQQENFRQLLFTLAVQMIQLLCLVK